MIVFSELWGIWTLLPSLEDWYLSLSLSSDMEGTTSPLLKLGWRIHQAMELPGSILISCHCDFVLERSWMEQPWRWQPWEPELPRGISGKSSVWVLRESSSFSRRNFCFGYKQLDVFQVKRRLENRSWPPNQKPEASKLSYGHLQIAGRAKSSLEGGCLDNL